MKKISYSDTSIIQYPVGENMDKAIQFINRVSQSILDNINEGQVRGLNVWVRGSSGAILGALLAQKFLGILTVKVMHLKKKGERSHNGGYNAGLTPQEGYTVTNIILDDEVATGETINEIYKEYHHIQVSSSSNYRVSNPIISDIDILVFDKVMGADPREWIDMAIDSRWPFIFVPKVLISTKHAIDYLELPPQTSKEFIPIPKKEYNEEGHTKF